jgi:membrane protein implicated in regulation of membrane protease activity
MPPVVTLPWWLLPLLLFAASIGVQYVVDAFDGGWLLRGLLSGALVGLAAALIARHARARTRTKNRR